MPSRARPDQGVLVRPAKREWTLGGLDQRLDWRLHFDGRRWCIEPLAAATSTETGTAHTSGTSQ